MILTVFSVVYQTPANEVKLTVFVQYFHLHLSFQIQNLMGISGMNRIISKCNMEMKVTLEKSFVLNEVSLQAVAR